MARTKITVYVTPDIAETLKRVAAIDDRSFVGRKLGALGVDDGVEVGQAVAGGGDAVVGQSQHVGRVAAAVRFLRVREQDADVGQAGGAEQGVGDRMEKDVGVAMADGMPIVRHVDAPQPQRSAGREAMGILSQSDP